MARADAVSLVKATRVSEGQASTFEWKCWCDDAGDVRWNLRQVLETQHSPVYKKAKFDVGAWLSRHRCIIDSVLQTHGASYAACVFSSRLAAQSRDEEQCTGGHKADFTCTSVALLVLLVWWSVAKLGAQQKVWAKSLCLGLLSEMLDAAANIQAVLEGLLLEVAPACQALPLTSGRCVHVQAVLQTLAGVSASSCAKRSFAILQALLRAPPACGALAELRAEFVGEIAQMMDGSIQAGRFEVELSELGPNRDKGQGKRRRIDEDWKQYIVNGAVERRQAKSGQAMLRAGGQVNPKVAPHWQKQELLAYQAACWRLLRKARFVCVVSDGARLGDPPEETVLFLLHSADVDAGAVLPPQAFPPS